MESYGFKDWHKCSILVKRAHLTECANPLWAKNRLLQFLAVFTYLLQLKRKIVSYLTRHLRTSSKFQTPYTQMPLSLATRWKDVCSWLFTTGVLLAECTNPHLITSHTHSPTHYKHTSAGSVSAMSVSMRGKALSTSSELALT